MNDPLQEELARLQLRLKGAMALETAVDGLLLIRETPGAGTYGRSVAEKTLREIKELL